MWCCCLCVSERSGVMRRNVVLLLVCFRENLCSAVRCTLVTVTLHLAYALSNHRHFTATVHICFVNQTMHLQIM